MSGEDRQGIDERVALIESRAKALAEESIATGAAWVRRLGELPSDLGDRGRWLHAAATVAAYRDHYQVTGDLPLGGGAVTDTQRAERQRAVQAAGEAADVGASYRPQLRPATEIRSVPAP
jgi:hypothetical protein